MTVPFVITHFRSVTETRGTRVTLSPEEMAAWFERQLAHAPTPSSSESERRDQKRRHLPVWCAAVLRDDIRKDVRVEHVTCLVFDFDGCPVAMPDAIAALRCLVAGHTSFSHRMKPGHCFRLVVPISRPLSTDEHALLWVMFERRFASVGAPLDRKARNPARAWYVPCKGPHYASFAELDRPVLDVDRALAYVPRALEPRRERARHGGTGSTDVTTSAPSSVLERASRYLASMPPAIQGSDGSGATMRAAVAMVRGFALDDADALALLVHEFNPRCVPPWSARELQHKVASAAKATRAGLGYLLNKRPR